MANDHSSIESEEVEVKLPSNHDIKEAAKVVALKLKDPKGTSLRKFAKLVQKELGCGDLISKKSMLRKILNQAVAEAEGEEVVEEKLPSNHDIKEAAKVVALKLKDPKGTSLRKFAKLVQKELGCGDLISKKSMLRKILNEAIAEVAEWDEEEGIPETNEAKQPTLNAENDSSDKVNEEQESIQRKSLPRRKIIWIAFGIMSIVIVALVIGIVAATKGDDSESKDDEISSVNPTYGPSESPITDSTEQPIPVSSSPSESPKTDPTEQPIPVSWEQVGLDMDGEDEYNDFGDSVSLSSDGNRVAIGAPLNAENGDYSGHVRVFDWNGSSWEQIGQDLDGEAVMDHFGTSVSLSSDGNRVAIGAPGNNGNGFESGHVRVFDWNGSSWQQVGLDLDGEARNDSFGRSVSLSSNGNRVAIGAELNDGNGMNSGHVRVFDWNGTSWEQVGLDLDGEDESGWSVSLSSDGNRVAIGAYSGHVRVFDWTGSSWEQVGFDLNGEAADDWSGYSVSLSSDGNRVAIGALGNEDSNRVRAGHVQVYEWNGSSWEQVGFDLNGEAADDLFGVSVSLSSDGNRVAIGAPFNDGNGSMSGHVRVFDWTGTSWEQIGLDLDGEAEDDRSGGDVSLSSDGNRVAIGAWANDGNGSDSGHVRVYRLAGTV